MPGESIILSKIQRSAAETRLRCGASLTGAMVEGSRAEGCPDAGPRGPNPPKAAL